MNKISDMPLYIKQILCERLYSELSDFACNDILKNGENFSSYNPTLTFKGETELTKKEIGLDRNIYNFLELSKKGLGIAEISVNTFLTLEEVSKHFEFCIEEKLVEKPESSAIYALVEYLSGKIFLGEYLLKIGKITEEQLNNAINQDANGKKFGEILISSGYVTPADIKAVLKLKEEAQKRFVLDCDVVPSSQMECVNDSLRQKDEISNLKSENKKLKAQLNKLLELVK